jgi:hypothetical protein
MNISHELHWASGPLNSNTHAIRKKVIHKNHIKFYFILFSSSYSYAILLSKQCEGINKTLKLFPTYVVNVIVEGGDWEEKVIIASMSAIIIHPAELSP